MSAFNVQSYVPISVANQFTLPDDQVWIAIFGQLIVNPGDNQTPPPGPTFYLDATALDINNQPVPQPAAALPPAGPATPDGVILPSFTLAQWGAKLSFPIPAFTGKPDDSDNTQFTGRIILSVGAPVQAQVAADGSVSSPNAASPSDPSTGTLYDFLEFTVASNSDNSNNVDIDTSQVDSFGLPILVQFFQDSAGAETYNISFTGNTTIGDATVRNLSTVTGLGSRLPILGAGIPDGGVIVSVSTASESTLEMTLNQKATETATAVQLTGVPAGPVGTVAARGSIFGGTDSACFAEFIQSQVNAGHGNAAPFLECNQPAPLRLVAPKDITEALTAQSTDPLNNYFNAQVDAFFLKYFSGQVTNLGNTSTGGGQTFSLQSGASKKSVTYSGVVQLDSGNYVLSLTDTSGVDKTAYTIFYPFFTSNPPAGYVPLFPPGPPPSSVGKKQAESASQMIFACDAVFADNARTGFDTVQAAVLGDLENSIAAAFNRGIVLNSPDTWGDNSLWFPESGAYNYWVQYWHQAGLAANSLAYAFPYDDKFGSSTNLQQSKLGLVKITLGGWGPRTQAALSFVNFPGSANQGGKITLTVAVNGAAGGAAPTGTVAFFVDGHPLNSAAVSVTDEQAVLSASLPPLPDGAHTHTYSVSAVYSGDANYQPGVVLKPLQLVGPNGDFPVILTPAQFAVGAPVSVAITLPLTTVNGTLALSLVDSLGHSVAGSGVSQSVSTAALTIPYTMPADTLTFTGTLSNGSAVITSVSSTDNLAPGQALTGTGIAAGAKVSAFNPTPPDRSVTMSENAIAASSGVVVVSDATRVTYTLVAVYTPANDRDTLTGKAPFAFQPASAAAGPRNPRRPDATPNVETPRPRPRPRATPRSQ